MNENKTNINCHIHVLGKLEENLGGIRVLWKKVFTRNGKN